jgi:hypothetical protein
MNRTEEDEKEEWNHGIQGRHGKGERIHVRVTRLRVSNDGEENGKI